LLESTKDGRSARPDAADGVAVCRHSTANRPTQPLQEGLLVDRPLHRAGLILSISGALVSKV